MHTPGPWKRDHRYKADWQLEVEPIRAETGELICEIPYPDQPIHKANGDLIEAAPEMWEMIQAIYEWAGEDSDQPLLFTPDWIQQVKDLFIRRMGGDPTSEGRTIAELKAEIDGWKKSYSRNAHWQGEALKHEELARQLSDLVVDLEVVVNLLVAAMTVDESISSQEIAALDMAEEVMAKVKMVRGE